MTNEGRLLLTCVLVLCAGRDASAADQPRDLTEIPFEALVQSEVLTASHLARQVSDSPSAVAIVTADEIRAYGYRTLADVINSMRGLYTTSDRRYDYMGGRGFGGSGDYTGRVMLQIDGYATQDSIYNQAYIDNSGLIDLELVERVEYVPGTGSVSYGNNALLGIINVVTKRGRDINGTQVSTEFSSFQGRKHRITAGHQLENGADVLFSLSRQSHEGQSHYFPGLDTPANNNGRSNHDMDAEDSYRAFAKIDYSGLSVSLGYVDRAKVVPSASYGYALFNGLYRVHDQNAFLNAQYETDVSLQLKSMTRVYYGSYRDGAFRSYNPAELDPGDNELYRQNRVQSSWAGLDQKFVGTWFSGHTLVFGAEFRDEMQQRVSRDYLDANFAFVRRYTENFSRRIMSLYVTDEIVMNDAWRVNLGARYDKATDQPGSLSPRFALIYTPNAQDAWKASYSKAFRLPNADERFDWEGFYKPEKVQAMEVNYQRQLSPHARFTSSLYHYGLSDLTYTHEVTDIDRNDGTSQTRGLELELEGKWPSGVHGRTSVAFQNAENIYGRWLVNSPKVLAKGMVSFPFGNGLRAGLEAHYLGARLTEDRRRESGTHYANLTFSTDRKWHGLSASFSIRNLFDKKYAVVAPYTRPIPSGGREDTLLMDGRNYWLQVTLDF